MKKLIAFLIAGAFLLTGCASQEAVSETADSVNAVLSVPERTLPEENTSETEAAAETQNLNFTSLSDDAFRQYVEENMYASLQKDAENEIYLIDSISTVYRSKEYIEEAEYNSKENIYFGYTLSELEEQFQGTKYIFTLGSDGQTEVKAFEGYDSSFHQTLNEIAEFGHGVMMMSVTLILNDDAVISASAKEGGSAESSSETNGAQSKITAVFAASAKSVKDFIENQDLLYDTIETFINYLINGEDFETALLNTAVDVGTDFVYAVIMGTIQELRS